MNKIKNLKILFAIFSVIIIADLIKFLSIGGTTLINWHSWIHLSWVFAALLLLFWGIILNNIILWRILFIAYFIVFIASILNQYVNFTSILTYNCALFNAIFAAIYLVI